MGLFRLVARVGCLRGGAIRRLEEWSPIRRKVWRWTEPGLQALWQFFCGTGGGEVAHTRRLLYSGRLYGQGKTIERLGLSPLARLWRVARGRGRAHVRPARLRRARRPARAEITEQPRRWYFCEAHAAEYNRNWNYFEGLTAEEAAAREANERRDADAFASANHYGWGGPGDGSRSRDEMRALDVLELESRRRFRGDQDRLAPPRQGQPSGPEAGRRRGRRALPGHAGELRGAAQGRGAEATNPPR